MGSQSHIVHTRRLIIEKLTEHQLQMFRAHPLGRLMDINFGWAGPLMHFVMLRQIEPISARDVRFFIGGQVMTYTIEDFKRINGLSDPDGVFITPQHTRRLARRFLNGQISFQKSYLETKFRECRVEEHDDSDMVKFALYFFFELVLDGSQRKNYVDVGMLEILDNPVASVTYPWAEFMWVSHVEGINRGISQQKLDTVQKLWSEGNLDDVVHSGPMMNGFCHAFQAWVYEKIPKLLEKHFVEIQEGAPIPLLGWRSGSAHMNQENMAGLIFKDLDKLSEEVLKELGVAPDNREPEREPENVPSTSSAPQSHGGAIHVELRELRAGMDVLQGDVRKLQEGMQLVQEDLRRLLTILSATSPERHEHLVADKDDDEENDDDDDKDDDEKKDVDEENDSDEDDEYVAATRERETKSKNEEDDGRESVRKRKREEEGEEEKNSEKEERVGGKENEEDEVVEEVDEEVDEENEKEEVLELSAKEQKHFSPRRSKRNKNPSSALVSPYVLLKRSMKIEASESCYNPLPTIEEADKEKFYSWLADPTNNESRHSTMFQVTSNKGWWITLLGTTNPRLGNEHMNTTFIFLQHKIRMMPIYARQCFTIACTEFSQYCERGLANKLDLVGWDNDRAMLFFKGNIGDYRLPWTCVDWVYILYNLDDKHWVLVGLDLKQKKICYWDSCPSYMKSARINRFMQPLVKALGPLTFRVGIAEMEEIVILY